MGIFLCARGQTKTAALTVEFSAYQGIAVESNVESFAGSAHVSLSAKSTLQFTVPTKPAAIRCGRVVSLLCPWQLAIIFTFNENIYIFWWIASRVMHHTIPTAVQSPLPVSCAKNHRALVQNINRRSYTKRCSVMPRHVPYVIVPGVRATGLV